MMFFSKINQYSKNAYQSMIVLGLALVIFGILLLVYPELLAYLISFFFILVGIIVLTMGWRVYLTQKKFKSKVEYVNDTIKDQVNNIKGTFDNF